MGGSVCCLVERPMNKLLLALAASLTLKSRTRRCNSSNRLIQNLRRRSRRARSLQAMRSSSLTSEG